MGRDIRSGLGNLGPALYPAFHGGPALQQGRISGVRHRLRRHLAPGLSGIDLDLEAAQRGPGVETTLASDTGAQSWLERNSLEALAATLLYGLRALTSLVLILLKKLFPSFGTWVAGVSAVVYLDLSIVVLAVLAWDTLRYPRRASIAGLVAMTLTAADWAATLAMTPWAESLALLVIPAYELDIPDGLPLQGWHLAAVAGVSFALVLWQLARVALLSQTSD